MVKKTKVKKVKTPELKNKSEQMGAKAMGEVIESITPELLSIINKANSVFHKIGVNCKLNKEFLKQGFTFEALKNKTEI